MRRHYTGRNDRRAASSQGEQGFWPSYADMMSAVALILFFLMLLAYVQNLITGNDLQNTKDALEETLLQVIEIEDQLKLTEDQLKLTEDQVRDAENELSLISLDLEGAKLTLAMQEEEIAKQQGLIDQQKEYVKAADEELINMRSQMQTIAVLRLSILEQIRDSIVGVMGDASKVSIHLCRGRRHRRSFRRAAPLQLCRYTAPVRCLPFAYKRVFAHFCSQRR